MDFIDYEPAAQRRVPLASNRMGAIEAVALQQLNAISKRIESDYSSILRTIDEQVAVHLARGQSAATATTGASGVRSRTSRWGQLVHRPPFSKRRCSDVESSPN